MLKSKTKFSYSKFRNQSRILLSGVKVQESETEFRYVTSLLALLSLYNGFILSCTLSVLKMPRHHLQSPVTHILNQCQKEREQFSTELIISSKGLNSYASFHGASSDPICVLMCVQGSGVLRPASVEDKEAGDSTVRSRGITLGRTVSKCNRCLIKF